MDIIYECFPPVSHPTVSLLDLFNISHSIRVQLSQGMPCYYYTFDSIFLSFKQTSRESTNETLIFCQSTGYVYVAHSTFERMYTANNTAFRRERNATDNPLFVVDIYYYNHRPVTSCRSKWIHRKTRRRYNGSYVRTYIYKCLKEDIVKNINVFSSIFKIWKSTWDKMGKKRKKGR